MGSELAPQDSRVITAGPFADGSVFVGDRLQTVSGEFALFEVTRVDRHSDGTVTVRAERLPVVGFDPRAPAEGGAS